LAQAIWTQMPHAVFEDPNYDMVMAADCLRRAWQPAKWD